MDYEVSIYREPAWWAILLRGIVALLLGIFLVARPGPTLFVLVVFLGAYWLIQGAIALADAFVGPPGSRGAWRVIGAIVSILAGLFVLAYPAVSTLLLPAVYVIVLGIAAIVSGVAHIAHGATGGGGGSIVLGIVDVILGLVLLGAPYVAALAVPFVLGILAIVGGIVLIGFSFALRSHQHQAPHTMAPA